MATAIISGLIATDFASTKSQIFVSEPWDVNRDKIASLGVRTTTSNAEAAANADILILAVKPQVAKTVCEDLAASWSGGEKKLPPLVVSIAAGISVASLRKWCTTTDEKVPSVVRVMPNTPALLGEGASGVYAGEGVSEAQKALVTALLGSVSKATEWVDKEELIDVVTGLSGKISEATHVLSLSPHRDRHELRTLHYITRTAYRKRKLTIPLLNNKGSGPAYFFAMVEHLIAAGTKLGLSEEVATRLAKQTCLGAGRMLVEDSQTSPAQLRKNVTSPNGTTEAALKSFEASGFAGIVEKAVKAASDRGEELGRTLGEM